jgi:hypothetical protein
MDAMRPVGLPKPDAKVLNLRSECGIVLDRLREECGVQDLYALDHFDSNLRYARDDLGIRHTGRLSMTELAIPFEVKEYDLILANHAITHAPEPMTVLRGLRALLAPEATLVMYGEEDHLELLKQGWLHERGIPSFHLQLLCERSLMNLCRLAGLEPKLLACHAEGIPWASSHHQMMMMARRSEPLPRGAIERRNPIPLFESYREGRRSARRKRRRRYLKRAKAMVVGPFTRASR